MNPYDTQSASDPEEGSFSLFFKSTHWEKNCSQLCVLLCAYPPTHTSTPTTTHPLHPHGQETGLSWGKEESLHFLQKSFDSCPFSYRIDLNRKSTSTHASDSGNTGSQAAPWCGSSFGGIKKLLGDEHKPVLHRPLPTDPQGDQLPHPKLTPHPTPPHSSIMRHWAREPFPTFSSLSVKVSLHTVY